MRIISGLYKGNMLDGFHMNGTRPTMDRVKESLFGMIQMYIKGSTCLDLFAGSGSLGLEALSNGASISYFVDSSKEAVDTINRNIEKLGNPNAVVLKQDYQNALSHFSKNHITFDLIFLDPPYAKHYIQECIKKIEELQLLKPEGLIICEYETEIFDSSYFCIKDKKYGSTHIKIYQYQKK